MPIISRRLKANAKDSTGNTVSVPPRQALAVLGPCFQVSISLLGSMADQIIGAGGTLPTPVTGEALLDTGASVSCIDESVAQSMGLPVIDVAQMSSASHASTPANIYPIEIEVLGVGIKINVARAMGANLQPQFVAIIGRDALSSCTFFYNGVTGEITLAM